MLQNEALKQMNSLGKEMSSIYHDIALKLCLSDSGFDILYSICSLGNGCLQRDICEMSFSSKQTINSSIKNMEKMGYIRLEQGQGRDKKIYLTKAGEQLMEERIAPVIACENQILEAFDDDECAVLLKLMKKYNVLLREKLCDIKDYRRG